MVLSTYNITSKNYVSDLNDILINFYINVRDKPDELIIELNKLADLEFLCEDCDFLRKPITLEDALSSK